MVSVFQWPLKNLEVIFFIKICPSTLTLNKYLGLTLHNVATLETSSVKVTN